MYRPGGVVQGAEDFVSVRVPGGGPGIGGQGEGGDIAQGAAGGFHGENDPVIAAGQGLGIGQLVQGKENPLEGVVFLRQGEVLRGGRGGGGGRRRMQPGGHLLRDGGGGEDPQAAQQEKTAGEHPGGTQENQQNPADPGREGGV
ncbi:MAG: hypothetical protein ACLT9P_00455 [Evtepia gabavorous]